ncbi:calcium/proton exchanger [Effusibacillus lacus]|uniref:Ca(2+)/H(+) antiporter n=1 Tax=Effusibacillus lacus TaxID=1348429 RepID=A0A292YS14_9BACL|nr:calcium/proton exchanger [Effusibacillus lacus]TCS74888.1 Ca2+:H+ antiporter [Effusibacillus lacus]GAX91563.1 calcium/proton exchanger [Effusibacillus lacus]
MQKVWILLLVIFLPLTVIGNFLHFSEVLLFVLASVTILPLASYMGRATESIAIHSGPRIGGLLNATFGNAVELIIAFFALRKGLTQVVQASLTGSVIGNLLLVAGLSFLVGGLKYPVQKFNASIARTNSSMMMLGVVIAMIIPAIFNNYHPGIGNKLSIGVAIVSLTLYLLGLYFALFTHKHLFSYTDGMEEEEAEWTMGKASLILALATLAVAYVSETLVHTIETVSHTFGWSEVFIGVIIVAIIGNAAEHSSAILMAYKNRMDLSLEIAVGSSLQIAMFVAPVLVFAGLIIGQPLPLVFTWPELAAMTLAVLLTAFLANDGESNWLEGAMALGAYLIIGIGFYFL